MKGIRTAALVLNAAMLLGHSLAGAEAAEKHPAQLVENEGARLGVEIKNWPEDRAFSQFDAIEIELDVTGSGASNPYMPYEADAPAGAPGRTGISVDALFEAPDGAVHAQPAFYYQRFTSSIVAGKEWTYPTGEFSWMVRFTPDAPGVWNVQVKAKDQSGSAEG